MRFFKKYVIFIRELIVSLFEILILYRKKSETHLYIHKCIYAWCMSLSVKCISQLNKICLCLNKVSQNWRKAASMRYFLNNNKRNSEKHERNSSVKNTRSNKMMLNKVLAKYRPDMITIDRIYKWALLRFSGRTARSLCFLCFCST